MIQKCIMPKLDYLLLMFDSVKKSVKSLIDFMNSFISKFDLKMVAVWELGKLLFCHFWYFFFCMTSFLLWDNNNEEFRQNVSWLNVV